MCGCVCVCIGDSNDPFSLKPMPLADVIQLLTEKVNMTMNCIHKSFTINLKNKKNNNNQIIALTVADFGNTIG